MRRRSQICPARRDALAPDSTPAGQAHGPARPLVLPLCNIGRPSTLHESGIARRSGRCPPRCPVVSPGLTRGMLPCRRRRNGHPIRRMLPPKSRPVSSGPRRLGNRPGMRPEPCEPRGRCRSQTAPAASVPAKGRPRGMVADRNACRAGFGSVLAQSALVSLTRRSAQARAATSTSPASTIFGGCGHTSRCLAIRATT